MDVIEGIEWGRHFQLGYDKHPPLAPWLTYLAYVLGDETLWSIYALSQIGVIACFWFIRRLGADLFQSQAAGLAGSISLAAIYVYTHTAAKFNPDALLFPLWAGSYFFFYRAIKQQKLGYWIGLGVFLGLSFLTKYITAFLMLSMAAYLLWDKKARKSFSQKGIYMAGVVFFLVVFPHVYWLISNDFLPIKYASARVGAGDDHWLNHLQHPAKFILAQAVTILPILLLLWPFIRRQKADAVNRSFFSILFLGPFVLSALLSLVTGMWLYTMWAVPFFSLTGVWLLGYLRPQFTSKSMALFKVSACIVLLLNGAVYFYVREIRPQRTHKFANVHFPGDVMARLAENLWKQRFGEDIPLAYVAGPRRVAAPVSLYATDKPVSYFEWNQAANPWINEEDLRKKGAIFIMDKDFDGPAWPEDLKRWFPQLEEETILYIPWYVVRGARAVRIGIRILPPS